MKEIFREYDIRGIINESLNEDIIKKIGYHLGIKIKEQNLKNIAVGYDCRTHGKDIFNWLISGLNKAEIKVYNLGEIATPIAYFAGYQKNKDNEQIDSSIMITGSHLPPEYNGLKITINNKSFFGKQIYKLGEEVINSKEQIEDNYENTKIDIRKQYINYIINEFQHFKNFNREIIIDTGNGVGGPILKEITTALNMKTKILFEEPDGRFPNHIADPLEPKNNEFLVKELKANPDAIGLALDGDCDRVFVLENAEVIPHDKLVILLARQMDNPTIIGEVRCSKIMYDEINKFGTAIMSKAGHSNIKAKIRETDATMGIELSGHIFFNDKYFGFDDGIYSLFRILELYLNKEHITPELNELPKTFSTPENKIPVAENIKFKKAEQIITHIKQNLNNIPNTKSFNDIDGIRIEFKSGWGLVRPSNTSPYLTVRFEATNQKDLNLQQKSIMNIIETILNG